MKRKKKRKNKIKEELLGKIRLVREGKRKKKKINKKENEE